MRDHDIDHETPGVVIASIALGVSPLPFLVVYAVLFLAHGWVYPVEQPDITGSHAGEAAAGVVALLLAVLISATLWWFLNAHRRWPFVLGQLATLAAAVGFALDSRSGPPAVPVALLLTSAAALVLAVLPGSWQHLGYSGRRWPGRSRRRLPTPVEASPGPAERPR